MKNGLSNRLISAIRWIARIIATLSAGLILVIFIGEGIDDGIEPLFQLTVREQFMFVAFGTVWVGLILGLKSELWGGLLIIGGMIAFHLFDFAFSGNFPRGPFFLIFASPGVIFLLYAWLIRKTELEQDGF
jgi:hypothetical protein